MFKAGKSLSIRCNLRSMLTRLSFDAWLLKPIDVQRLSLLLRGVKNPELRRNVLYAPGHWEDGGWFLP
jgi:hypothetical protein